MHQTLQHPRQWAALTFGPLRIGIDNSKVKLISSFFLHDFKHQRHKSLAVSDQIIVNNIFSSSKSSKWRTKIIQLFSNWISSIFSLDIEKLNCWIVQVGARHLISLRTIQWNISCTRICGYSQIFLKKSSWYRNAWMPKGKVSQCYEDKKFSFWSTLTLRVPHIF